MPGIQKDLRVEMKVKNNILYRAIFDSGSWKTISTFCRHFGLSQTRVGALLSLKISPLRKDGSYLKLCKDLSAVLALSCDELFPLHLYNKTGTNLVIREISWEEAARFVSSELTEQQNLPDDLFFRKELQEQFSIVLGTLTPLEEKVIRLLYGFDESEQTLEEVGDRFSLTRERIRQIELRAIGKLSRVRRRKYIEPFLEVSP
ncbi:hypothetical protein HYV70_02320 [Candidatus Uhrbacteria bacterium]|nr:hypothetical protein [Candidatus Uhrbacteria bacterium]